MRANQFSKNRDVPRNAFSVSARALSRILGASLRLCVFALKFVCMKILYRMNEFAKSSLETLTTFFSKVEEAISSCNFFSYAPLFSGSSIV